MVLRKQTKATSRIRDMRTDVATGLCTVVVGVLVGSLFVGLIGTEAFSEDAGVVEPTQSVTEGGDLQESIDAKAGGGLTVSNNVVEFPPMTRDAIDYFFDILRSGGHFQPTPLRQSQQVPNNVVGIWAGVRSSFESRNGVIALRFRPRAEAKLERAQGSNGVIGLVESFDVELELKDREFFIRHSLAVSKSARVGLTVGLKDVKLNPVLTEFVKGHQDSGIYFAWPPLLRSSAHNAWSLLVCPRTYTYVQPRRNEDARLELQRSPYELREVNFALSATARARIPPTDRPERISVNVVASGNLPLANLNKDEVVSLSPNLEVPYRPATSFDFFKIPSLDGHVQEGVLARIETENPAGYIRRQYHSHVVYMHQLDEPSPVPVIIGDRRAARDEGTCYIVGVQRSTWNHYDRLSRSETSAEGCPPGRKC